MKIGVPILFSHKRNSKLQKVIKMTMERKQSRIYIYLLLSSFSYPLLREETVNFFS